jgi:hypothetical protein
MKEVLIITYYWPPAGGPGVQRWLKFVKYLRDFGWEPVVLTVADGVFPATDESLFAEIPEGLAVYRTRSGGPLRLYSKLKGQKGGQVPVALISAEKKRSWFEQLALWIRSNGYIPDARKGWYRYALRGIAAVMQDHKPVLVVTTGPPHSTHLIGKTVAHKYGLPWLADFRDPWTTVYYNYLMPRTNRTKRVDRQLESQVLQSADCVVTVSDAMKEEFLDRAGRVEVIRNGFDEDDMPAAALITGPEERFVLLHTGNIAPNQHVPALWDALSDLADRDVGFRRDLQIRLVGNVDGNVLRYIDKVGLADCLDLSGYVPHLEATTLMQSASLLLLLIPEAPGNRAIVTGKIFEYLLAGVPVLGIGPLNGDADAILKETDRGKMIDYQDKEMIRKAIGRTYNRWLENDKVTERMSVEPCRQFNRRQGTEKLAALLDSLLKQDEQAG